MKLVTNCSISYMVEAYKSIIDFNKTIITISSSLLTAIIAYIIYQDIDLKYSHYLTLIAIVASIIFSLFGFGYSIQTVKDGKHRTTPILFTNIGASIMIIGICFILTFHSNKPNSIDLILRHIEKSTLTLKKNLKPENFKSIELKDNKYIINYLVDSLNTQVIYSNINEEIISIK